MNGAQSTPPLNWPKLVRPGSRVYAASGASFPHALLEHMLEHHPEIQSVQFVQLLGLDSPVREKLLALDAEQLRMNAFSLGGGIFEEFRRGKADYTPAYLSQLPGILASGMVPLETALVQVSPPNGKGLCSLAPCIDITPSAVGAARHTVAQINSRVPRNAGFPGLRMDSFAATLEADEALAEVSLPEPTETERAIARNLLTLLRPRDTLHLEFNEISQALYEEMTKGGWRGLSLHTEILSGAAMQAIRAGVFSGPGWIKASMALGTAELYGFLDGNTEVLLLPTAEINSPRLTGAIPQFVSVTTATQVDLTGLAGTVRGSARFRFSMSSQLDFMRGAALSEGGRPVLALPSREVGTGAANIVPAMEAVRGGVMNRADVHYVVTEYGVAHLWGLTMRERVLEMCRIAHPEDREELLRHAREMHAIETFQAVRATQAPEFGPVQAKEIQLKDGGYLLRPLRPADARTLQEFFYSHSPETVHLRYGYTVTAMSQQRAQELVSVPQDKDLALGVFSRPEDAFKRESLWAVGRYFLDPDGKSAEVAFVAHEEKRNIGMASALMEALLTVARRRGLDNLWAQVEKGNQAMLQVFRKYGGTIRTTAEGYEVTIPTDVTPAPQ